MILEPIHVAAERLGVDELVLALPPRFSGSLPLADLVWCHSNAVTVFDLASFYERIHGSIRLDSLDRSAVEVFSARNMDVFNRLQKRAFDIAVSAVLLLSVLPLVIVAAVAMRLESRGPVFWRQSMVGLGGRTFLAWRFRTLRVIDSAAYVHGGAAPRVTRVGWLIRVLRLDEVPLLLNVLLGDMSIVGPRPEREAFVKVRRTQILWYDLRHIVRPGLTGWAQVRYSYGASVEDDHKRLELDLYYVKNGSLFLDLLILIETLRVVLFREPRI